MIWNIVIISVMITLMLVIVIFAKKQKNSSDFFRSSGSMPWWLVGALGFVGQFSSWAFTGAQSEAYKNGMLVAFIFIANFVGFMIVAIFMAPRARRMRALTGSDAIRQRYGKNASKIITIVRIINNTISPAIRIIALGVVISVVVHIDQIIAIALAGLMVAIFSAFGGIKILASFSFSTTILLMSITLITSIFALGFFGGNVFTPSKGLPGKEMHDISHALFGSNFSSIWFPISWTLFIFIKQTTNIFSGYNNYNTVKNEKSARKAALMTSVLMLFAALLWFIPSWAMKANGISPSHWSTAGVMGNKVMDSVYLEYLIRYMPIGFLGVISFCLLISTISSTGTALNRNAANIIRNLRTPKYSKQKELMLSKITVLLLGLAITGAAASMHYIKGFSLFDIMQVFTTSFGLPITIPIILGFFFVRKTNDKIVWPTMMIGAFVSIFTTLIMNQAIFENIFDIKLNPGEWPQVIVIMSVSLHICITVPSFLLLAKFWKSSHNETRKYELEFFFKKMDTPINKDNKELNKESCLTAKNTYKNIIWFSVPLIVFAFIPESKLIYNFAYVFAAMSVIGIYLLMRYKTNKELKRIIENPIYDPVDEMTNEKSLEEILKEYVALRKNGKTWDWGER